MARQRKKRAKDKKSDQPRSVDEQSRRQWLITNAITIALAGINRYYPPPVPVQAPPLPAPQSFGLVADPGVYRRITESHEAMRAAILGQWWEVSSFAAVPSAAHQARHMTA